MNLRGMHRTILFAVLGAIAVAGEAEAQAYPSRPIKLLVPFTPGGGTDILARIVAGKMAESMGQSILVDNRPGASGMTGADAVARNQDEVSQFVALTPSHQYIRTGIIHD